MPRLQAALCGALIWALLPAALAYDYDSDFDPADQDTWPVIAIIIDDLGDRAVEGRHALALPGPVACSILPHTPYAREFSVTAHARGKEVLLHQPLEADTRNHLLGPGAMRLGITRAQMRATLRDNLATLRYVSGVNNHMGSFFTRHAQQMGWLMRELQATGDLYFVDSVTTGGTRGQQQAELAGIANARRDVFLDHVQEAKHVASQFELLKRSARRQGYALGIGHPFTVTLDMLDAALPRLAATGYRLVSVRELISVRAIRQKAQTVTAGSAEPVRKHRQD
ncbi:MAG: divergent polysaccharide deacetylase family protein [Gammaproteobacteria bacterium]